MIRRLGRHALVAMLLLSAPAAGTSGGSDRVLFNTVLADIQEPGGVSVDSLPADVRSRVLTFQARLRRFQSGLPRVRIQPGPERWQDEKRREMEKGLVALIDRQGIEAAARDYAREAALGYEWEGMSDGPLAEAAFAEGFLEREPATALRPYLELFLAHRYRCAAEVLSRENQPEARKRAAAAFRRHLRRALKDADPLVRFVAADLERRPYLYMAPEEPAPGKRGPAAAAGEREAATTTAAACPDTAIFEPIADPRAWALKCLRLVKVPATTPADSLIEFTLDLNADGAPEIFLGSAVGRGPAEHTYYLFERRGAAYRYLGSLLLPPAAVGLLISPATARPTLTVCTRLQGGVGVLETLAYDGRAFVIERSEKVSFRGDGRQRLTDLFGARFGAAPDSAPGVPAITLDQALALAARFVGNKKANLSAQHIRSVVLRRGNEGERPRHYWHVQWMWNRVAIGGEYGLHVHMDGTITEARLGP